MAKGYKIEKIEINKDRVGALLKSSEVMSALKKNAKSVGQIDSDWVGFDRCHVTIKKEGQNAD